MRFAGTGTCGGERRHAPEWFDTRYAMTNAPEVVLTGAGMTGVDASLAAHAQFTGTVTRADTGAVVQNVAVEVLDTAPRAKRPVSATLTLVARTAAGETRTTARVKKLR